ITRGFSSPPCRGTPCARSARRLLYHRATLRHLPPPMSNVLMRQLRQAEKSLHAGDAATAQTLCEQVLRKAPRNPEALYFLGTAQRSQQRTAEAIATLERVRAVDPEHGAALETLGLAH